MILDLIKRLFKVTEYKTVWTGKCTAYRSSVFYGPIIIPATVIFKVSTNRDILRWQLYMTDGDIKKDLEVAVVVATCPEFKDILKKYNIKC